MSTLWRFADLKANGIITSWPMLKRRVDNDGFPPGKMLGPNTRVWIKEDVLEWIKSRPDAPGKPKRGRPKFSSRRQKD